MTAVRHQQMNCEQREVVEEVSEGATTEKCFPLPEPYQKNLIALDRMRKPAPGVATGNHRLINPIASHLRSAPESAH